MRIRDVQALAFPPAQNSPGAFVLEPHYTPTVKISSDFSSVLRERLAECKIQMGFLKTESSALEGIPFS